MKLVYTQENRFDVSAMQAFLESHGVATFLKNEHTSSIMGEVPFFEVWPEIWVADELFETAQELVQEAQVTPVDGADWLCGACREQNPGTFEICWQCESARR